MDDDERKKRIILVAEYIIETGSSTRKAAEFFTENFFPISNVTVHNYCNLYVKLYPKKKEVLEKVKAINKTRTINDIEVQKQILYNAKLVLEGKTIEEIVLITGESYWSIYRDLTERLPKLDRDLYEKIKEIFKERKNNNLRK